MTELRSLAVSHHVDRIVSALDATPLVYPDARQMRTFGRVENEGGALVAPACGSVSLIGNTGR
jgi:hypothetical protein